MLFDKVKIDLDFGEKLVEDNTPMKEVEIKVKAEGNSNLFKYAIDKGYLESNDIYIKQLFKNTFIVIDFLNDTWESYKITFDDINNIRDDKTIVTDINLINVINRTERYIQNYLHYVSRAS